MSNEFLSTPSARRATDKQVCSLCGGQDISIHALREEGDHAVATTHPGAADFYPRPPRGGRLSKTKKPRPFLQISIHALREEGDP